MGRIMRLRLSTCRTTTVPSDRRAVEYCGEAVTVLGAGRVRYGGVQDGGTGHFPRRQSGTASRM